MNHAGDAFPRQLRLTTKADFDKVFHHGSRVNGRLFTAVVLGNDLNHPRLGLAISRRSAGSAVSRNRLKRQIRETFRGVANDLENVDIVVLARPEAVNENNIVCRENLGKLWNKVNQQCAR